MRCALTIASKRHTGYEQDTVRGVFQVLDDTIGLLNIGEVGRSIGNSLRAGLALCPELFAHSLKQRLVASDYGDVSTLLSQCDRKCLSQTT